MPLDNEPPAGGSPAPETIKAVRRILAEAQKVVVLTGAGVSAESGVPTFRGAGGIWRNKDVTALATPEGFARDPELVWEFYNWRRELLDRCEPNPAHQALVKLEQVKPDFLLVTQNVDGLHARAGSRKILELHGNTWRTRCPACGRKELDQRSPVPYPPLCPDCGQMVRPDVVWFGETLEPEVLGEAVEACRSCDLLLVVGTSALVQPAASLVPLAKGAGAKVVEVNLEPTPNTGLTDFFLLGPAGEILPRLADSRD